MKRIWKLLLLFTSLILLPVVKSSTIPQFIVVAGNQVIGKFNELKLAKDALKAYKAGVTTPTRMIAEVKDGRVVRDPRFVGGEEQAAGLLKGFNIWWNTWNDIDSMLNVAQNSLGDVRGKFLIVTRKEVMQEFSSLDEAKNVLMSKFNKHSTSPSRMIVEVIDKLVDDDPRIVGGQGQELGLNAGFNRYWNGWDDIDQMLYIAQAYIDQPKEDVQGVFIVVVDGKAQGKYTMLSQAKSKLMEYPKSYTPPSRMVCEVKNDRVNDDPRWIAGRNQEIGLSHGFNRYWRGWDDIDEMLWICENHLHKPTGDPEGTFLVVVGDKVIGKYDKLSAAKNALNGQTKAQGPPIRAVLEVKDGVVLDDPRYIADFPQVNGLEAGFNKYWTGWDDIDNMLYTAELYLLSMDNPKGTFVVVVGDRAIGKYSDLNSAKEALNSVPLSSPLSRLIVEVENGQVLNDPRFIAGQNQGAGHVAGFNRQWTGWPDIDRMLDIAQGYINGPSPTPSPSPKPSDKPGDFLVIVDYRAVGRFNLLSQAKNALSKYPEGATSPSRVIVEVINGVPSTNIDVIAGERQVDGPKAGFNKWWTGPDDIKKLLDGATSYLNPTVKGDFVVIAGLKPVGRFDDLSDAKDALSQFPSGATTPSRAVFEVMNGKCNSDPYEVGGQNQGAGLAAGFNKWWKDWFDIYKMLTECQNYVNTMPSVSVSVSPRPSSSTPDVPTSNPSPYSSEMSTPSASESPMTHYFLVVNSEGNSKDSNKWNVVGRFPDWESARDMLPGLDNSKAVVEVKGNMAMNPDIVDGQPQAEGPGSGWDKFWHDFSDKKSMWDTAQGWVDGNGADPSPYSSRMPMTSPSSSVSSMPTLDPSPSSSEMYSPSPSESPTTHYFLVVNSEGNSKDSNKWNVVGRFPDWESARAMLPGLDNSKAVVEVKGNTAQNPDMVDGQPQGAGPDAGWDKFWHDFPDKKGLWDTAQGWVDRNAADPSPYSSSMPMTSPSSASSIMPSSDPSPSASESPEPHYFLVVNSEGNSKDSNKWNVVGRFPDWESARDMLPGLGDSKAVVEVKGDIAMNPDIVDGQNQGAGLDEGWDKFWHDYPDKKSMWDEAQKWVDGNKADPSPYSSRVPITSPSSSVTARPTLDPSPSSSEMYSPSPSESPTAHYFLVVNSEGDAKDSNKWNVVGRFPDWESARAMLPGLDNSKAVVEVKGNTAQNPDIVDGQPQAEGPDAGWDKFWHGYWDKKSMWDEAQKWVDGSAPDPSPYSSRVPITSPSTSSSVMASSTPSASTSVMASSSSSASTSIMPSTSPSASTSIMASSSPSASTYIMPSTSSSVSTSIMPSTSPSASTSIMASSSPSASTYIMPSSSSSASTSIMPSSSSSASNSVMPSSSPSGSTSIMPSSSASASTSIMPSSSPTTSTSVMPSSSPTASTSVMPSSSPTASTSIMPSSSPTASTSIMPSSSPTASTSIMLSSSPSASTSIMASSTPSVSTSIMASSSPSMSTSIVPSSTPSASTSIMASSSPSASISVMASSSPSMSTSIMPSSTPSASTSIMASTSPSASTSVMPSASSSASTSIMASTTPSATTSVMASSSSSASISMMPSSSSSASTSVLASLSPSASSSVMASSSPSASTSIIPSSTPSLSSSPSMTSSPSLSSSISPWPSPSVTQSPAVPHYFVVTSSVGDSSTTNRWQFVARYDTWQEARDSLQGMENSRAVFEIIGRDAQRDPHMIAGQNQGAGLTKGWDKSWRDDNDIRGLWVAAQEWTNVHGDHFALMTPSISPSPSRTPDSPHYFIIMKSVGDSRTSNKYEFHQKYDTWQEARDGLVGIPDSKAVFEVKRRDVEKDPTFIAGQNQGGGATTGWDKFWWDQTDIDGMWTEAQLWVATRGEHLTMNLPSPTFTPTVPHYYLIIVSVGDSRNTQFTQYAPFGNIAYTVPEIQAQMTGLQNSRAVWEIIGRDVQKNPVYINGIPQNSDNGFNSFWWGWDDLNGMWDMATKWVTLFGPHVPMHTPSNTPSPTPSPAVPHAFIVVQGSDENRPASSYSVIGRYWTWEEARTRMDGVERSHATFEVVGRDVVKDPHIIAGQNQGAGAIKGWDRYWHNQEEIDLMWETAQRWWSVHGNFKDFMTPSFSPSPTRTPIVPHYFLVINSNGDSRVSQDYTVVGNFNTWEEARDALVGLSNSRAVIEVIKQVAQTDPHIIAGQNQGGGATTGWNTFWYDWADIQAMVAKAQDWVDVNG